MNKVQFNAVCLICSTIICSQSQTTFSLMLNLFIAVLFGISYFSQKKEMK